MDSLTTRRAAASLQVAVGHVPDAGRKAVNQDFHGLCVPLEPVLGAKGIAIALADGISSSQVSHIASETAVASFLEDYYCTPETWSVKKSAQKVLSATNAWLHAQTRQRHPPGEPRDQDRGYLCTMSVLVLKGATAHILHVGDARIHRLRGGVLEPLTDDHRVRIAPGKSYLARALGLAPQLEIDYHTQAIELGDVFVLSTDGVHEYVDAQAMVAAIAAHPHALDEAARALTQQAHDAGSDDNLTVQIIRVDALPAVQADEIAQHAAQLPCPPLLTAGEDFEGFRILDELHASSRSHVYLAEDIDTGERVVIKIPSLDLRHDPAYLERLLSEEWLARRIDSRHVLRAWPRTRPRRALYTVSEYLPGTTLTRWMHTHPRPTLEHAVALIEQVARGLQALHRLEVVHQDLRPDNIIITPDGIAKIIDLGAARVAGIVELAASDDAPLILGTAQYTAPEVFLGEAASPRADLYSLATMLYQMLSGRLPYGADVAKARSRAAQLKLTYVSVRDPDRELPAWIDSVLSRALHPDPEARYGELSEFTFALRHPESALARSERLPLLERNPVAFWRGVSLILALVIAFLLFKS